MRVWLITVGEPLPIDNTADRLYRTGLIASYLAADGHDVVWWTSTLDHIRKRQRAERSTAIDYAANLKIILLRGPTYRRNVSVARLINHLQVAREFARLAPMREQPDVILCSLPTVELCNAAARYAQPRGVPLVLDVRDLWPDIFADVLPKIGRSLSRHLLHPLFRAARRACSRANAIIGISPEFMEWGLRYAGRQKTAYDRVFAMGYLSSPPDEAAQRVARDRWRSLGLDDGKFNACYFGTMSRQFEIDTVVLAARRLAEAGVPMRFVLCGDGENRPRYQKLAEGLDSVSFPGWINQAEIWTLMRACHVGLAPYIDSSNYEGNLPNKPIEYMSAGLPIVSSMGGYLQALLERHQCGITYPNGNAEALANILEGLVRNRNAALQMGQNAHRLYNSQYRAESVYRDLIDYLEKIAAIGEIGFGPAGDCSLTNRLWLH